MHPPATFTHTVCCFRYYVANRLEGCAVKPVADVSLVKRLALIL